MKQPTSEHPCQNAAPCQNANTSTTDDVAPPNPAENAGEPVDERTDGRRYEVQPQRDGARLRVRYREGTTRSGACRLCR